MANEIDQMDSHHDCLQRKVRELEQRCLSIEKAIKQKEIDVQTLGQNKKRAYLQEYKNKKFDRKTAECSLSEPRKEFGVKRKSWA